MYPKVLRPISLLALLSAATACTAMLGDFDNKGSGGSNASSSNTTVASSTTSTASTSVTNSVGPTYTLGGTVSGLAAGTKVTLVNNGGDDVDVSANGNFVFPSALHDGNSFNVSVKTQPTGPSQTCVIVGGTGAMAGASVTNVAINCAVQSFTIAGTVTGLAPNEAVVLENNGKDDTTVSTNGTFAFTTPVQSGQPYSVKVISNPSSPVTEDCVVTQGTGTLGASNVTDVKVTCTTKQFTVGGTIAGLSAGNSVVLQNNAGDNLIVGSNSTFVFATSIPSGASYLVSVFTTATGEQCSVSGGSGTVSSANVTSVNVSCVVVGVCAGKGVGTVCRPANGLCDVAESCDGSSKDCPPDGFAGAGGVCRLAPDTCDVPETCDGKSAACPTDTFKDSSVKCRDAADVCDVPEYCTGSSATCPKDLFQAANYQCSPNVGPCDLPATCTGNTAPCPPNGFRLNTIVCRTAALGGCDVAEYCTGNTATCPLDGYAAPSTVCRPAATGLPCDAVEKCTGNSIACPSDGLSPPGTVCRPAASDCDVAETCTGGSGACPATNQFVLAGTACGTHDVCENQDLCDGAGKCVDYGLLKAGTACHSNPCLLDAACTGTSGACPAQSGYSAKNTFCRCDPADCSVGAQIWGCDGAGNCNVPGGTVFSCPILYTWNGDGFAFESDQYTSGTLGLVVGGKYRKPDPNDAYVLRQPIVEAGGTFEFRLVEELDEVDFLDAAHLHAVDVPADRQVVAWANNVPGAAIPLDQRLVSIGQTRQPLASAVDLTTGNDVTAALAASDGSLVTLSADNNNPSWNTIEVDLGDLSAASIIKLIVDGRSRFPTTDAGYAARQLEDPNGWQTKLEVLDGMGTWTQVSRSLVTLVKPKEFPRAMAIDITNVFLIDSYRLRLSWVNKTGLDAIWIDTTPNAPLTITEAPLTGATLDHHGFSLKNGGDFPVYAYAQPSLISWPLAPGSYTKYGDVMPLLGSVDDMFVVFGGGDQLAFTFQPPAAPAAGLARYYTFASVGYYKQSNLVAGGKVPFAVSPMPFGAMSNFPYDSTVEQYPTDAAHQDYLSTWNTRVAP